MILKDYAPNKITKLQGIVHAKIETEATERIVRMGHVTSKEDAPFSKSSRYLLVNAIECAMDDRVGGTLAKESLGVLRSISGLSRAVASISSGAVGNKRRHSPRPSSPATLKRPHHSSGSENQLRTQPSKRPSKSHVVVRIRNRSGCEYPSNSMFMPLRTPECVPSAPMR